MALTKEDFIKEIEGLSVMQLNELVEALKEKFNVTGMTAGMAVAGGGGDAAKAEEKTSFNVILKELGSNKIQVIKEVKSLLGIGLIEAKKLAESIGEAIKKDVPKEEAEEIKKKLEAAGATAEIQ